MFPNLRRVSWMFFLTYSLSLVCLAGPGPDKMASVCIRTISTYRPTVAGQGEIHTYLTRWFESQGVKVIQNAEWTAPRFNLVF